MTISKIPSSTSLLRSQGLLSPRPRPRDDQPGGRVRIRLRLRLHLPRSADPQAQIQELLSDDLSQGGVFVTCREPPAVGEVAMVEVCRPGGGVAFAAEGR